MRLKNQVAIVTGGGGGIGEGICLCLAREGAHVVVSDINKDSAERVADKVRAARRKAFAIKTDVSVEKECHTLIDMAIKQMKQIDILICSAGVNGFFDSKSSKESGTLEGISEEAWDMTININLKGVFLCNRAVAPYFREQKKGKIINISSTSGRRGIDFLPHYCASKAGVILLTQSVALQLAPFNVNANTICPGKIWTPMWEKMAENIMPQILPQFEGKSSREIFDTMIESTVPLKRPQTVEDVGNAVVFFASQEANNITGQALNVDGGSVFN